MTTINQALRDFLVANASIQSLVGERIYYVRAPQNVTAPYIIIQQISTMPEHAHDGLSGIADSRFQITCFASTYKAVKDINAVIDSILQNYVGNMGSAQWWWTGYVYVGRCFKDGEIDLWEDEVELYNSPLDYLIQHN